MSNKTFASALIYAVLICGGFVMLLPFLWMLSTSVKPGSEVLTMPIKWIPSRIRWDNYRDMWHAAPFLRYALNSVAVTAAVTAGELLTSVLAAFAFARLQFFGKNVLFCVLIGSMMVPGELLLIPNYVTIAQLGWIDRYEALIVPWISGAGAVYFLKQYFQECPLPYYEAAVLDHASNLAFLRYIQLPLAVPALTALGLLKGIAVWNSYIWPLLVTNTPNMRTVQLGLLAFSSETGTMYELLMAASSLIVLPLIAAIAWGEKHIAQAIAHGGMKG